MPSVKKGKKIVVWIIALLLVIDIIITIVTSSLYAINHMMEYAISNLLQGVVRFILTGILLFFLFKGHKWAKWTITILLLLCGLWVMISLLATFSFILLIMGIFCLGIGITLIASNSVNQFFKNQRGEIKVEDSCNNDIGQNM